MFFFQHQFMRTDLPSLVHTDFPGPYVYEHTESPMSMWIKKLNKRQLQQRFGQTKDKVIFTVRTVLDRVYALTRFSLLFKFILIIPVLCWLIMFQFSKYIPHDQRPTIDVATLPKLESWLLLGNSLQHFPRNKIPETEQWKDLLTFLDMTAAFAYLIHFVVTWIFAVFLFLFYRKKTSPGGYPVIQPYTFLWCFGFLNVFAVGTQLFWPTAPPWYVSFTLHSLSLPLLHSLRTYFTPFVRLRDASQRTRTLNPLTSTRLAPHVRIRTRTANRTKKRGESREDRSTTNQRFAPSNAFSFLHFFRFLFSCLPAGLWRITPTLLQITQCPVNQQD